MNLEQINLLKESYYKKTKTPDGSRDTTLGEYMRFCLDGGVDFITSKDLVVYDDENEMIHCMSLNSDAVSQANFPIKIMSSTYGMVQQVETIMSRENVDVLLNEGFMSNLLSDSRKKFISDWAKEVGKIQALQPNHPDPYYTQNPTVIPMNTKKFKRDDGIEHATSPATMNYGSSSKAVKVANTYEDLKAAISDDADVLINQDMEIPEVLSIAGNVTINIASGIKLTSDKNVTRPFELEDGAVLTIVSNGNSVIRVGKYGLVNIKNGHTNATVILNGGTYIANTDNGAMIKPRGDGNVCIKMIGVDYTDTSTNGYVINSANFDSDNGNLEITIDNCVLRAAYGVQAGNAVIKDSVFINDNNGIEGFKVNDSEKVTVNNCTFVIKNSKDPNGYPTPTAIGVGNNCTMYVNNCTIDSAALAFYNYSTPGTIRANNCKIINGGYRVDSSSGAIYINGDKVS